MIHIWTAVTQAPNSFSQSAWGVVSSQSTGRGFFSYMGFQRISWSVPKSPTVQILWLKGHENSRPIENISIPRGFLCEESSILIAWLISYQTDHPPPPPPVVSHGSRCSSSLFTDGHFLRHKVTVFHVQHSMSCRYNKNMLKDGCGQMALSEHWSSDVAPSRNISLSV